MKLRIPPERPPERLSERPPPRPEPSLRRPGPFVRVLADAETHQALRNGCYLLVRDGLEWLRRLGDRLPSVHIDLWREGRELDRALETVPPSAIRGLAWRGCGWYLRLHIAKAEGTGQALPDKLAELRQSLMGNGHRNTPPPDNRELAERMGTLIEHIQQIPRELHAFREETRTQLTRLEGEVGGLRQEVGGLDRKVDGLDRKVGGLEGEVGGLRQEVGGLRQEVGGLRQEVGGLDRKVGGLKGDMEYLKGKVGGLKGDMEYLKGEVSDQRGRRFESASFRATRRWLRDYSNASGIRCPAMKLLWSDRMFEQSSRSDELDGVLERLGINGGHRLAVTDLLIAATWPGDGKREPRALIIVGEVSTNMNRQRQQKVADCCRALVAAGHTVLPMHFGLANRVLVDAPHLVRVQIKDDDLRNRESITAALAHPPPALQDILHRWLKDVPPA